MTARFSLTWELDSLYPNPQTTDFRAALDELKVATAKLAEDSDTLPPVSGNAQHATGWSDFLKRYEAVRSEYTAIRAFIECHSAADAANKLCMQIEGELAAQMPQWSRISTNIEFALQAADDKTYKAFIAADPGLKINAYFLDTCRRNAALRLPKDQELLAADLDVDGLHAWGRLYDRLSGELRVHVMEKGEIVSKSPGQVDWDSPLREVRENNFLATTKAWRSLSDTCADAINHISGSRLTKYKRLGVDHLAAPLALNHMQRETLDAMWEAVTARKSCLAQYLKKKAELLGLDKLAYFDVDAPLPTSGTQSSTLSYDEACDLVLKSFAGFSPELGNFAKMSLDKRWIEVENRGGKRQGGFCTDLPTRKQSRIFMTFTNTVDSMSTLAHEIGHAYHTWVLRDEPGLLRDYPMNLAETASTFTEAVLAENRLASCQTREDKLALLDKMLGDSVAFLMNIHCRFIFENRFHQARANGEVPASRLSELMVAAQQEAYLNSLSDDGWYPLFWVSKLHFYITGWPFYNFPYTFGYLLSLGTYALAKDSPDFPAQFRKFLIATGNQDAEDAVQSSFGYDLRKPDFWHKSLDIVEQRAKLFLELAQ